MPNSSQLRLLHQASVIFSQSNQYYLPGLDASGALLPHGSATGYSGSGRVPGARFWVLLDGQFVPPDILWNRQEQMTALWSSGRVTREHYSYAALRLNSTNTDDGRFEEWKDNANSSAALISDRNIGKTSANVDVQSLWTTTPGDWMGNIVWGDNHAEFSTSHTGLKTRYLKSSSTNDNIFLDEPESAGSNAMMIR